MREEELTRILEQAEATKRAAEVLVSKIEAEEKSKLDLQILEELNNKVEALKNAFNSQDKSFISLSSRLNKLEMYTFDSDKISDACALYSAGILTKQEVRTMLNIPTASQIKKRIAKNG